ncbi:MAG: ABC transporter ATP-binding protein [Acidimicrobiia bacterium]
MLRVTDLTVRYGDVLATDRADLTLERDETLALLGRSGSGKTTVLRAIAGLVPMVSGSITLDGADLGPIPAHERSIGLVFQDFALFPHLDVGANVAYGLRMQGAADVENRVEEVLAMVGLDGLQRRRIDQLSGGQAQRVALARTLAPRPRLLLLDEPLGSLDPDLRRTLAGELKVMLDRTGVPAIVVTHDTEEAFALGDRVTVLVDGRVATTGTPAQIWSEPGTVEVARIVGHSGIVTATVAGGIATVAGLATSVEAPDGAVTLLIRPGAATIGGPIPTTVISSRYRGPDWVTTVALGGGSIEVSSPEPKVTGNKVDIAIDPSGVALLS